MEESKTETVQEQMSGNGPVKPPSRFNAKTLAAIVLVVLVATVAVFALTHTTVEVEEVRIIQEGDLTVEGRICDYVDIVDGTVVYDGDEVPEWDFVDLTLQACVEVSDTRYELRPYDTMESKTFSEGPGYYEVVLSEDGKKLADGRITVDGDVTRTYEWTYLDYAEQMDYDMKVEYTYDFSDYMEFRNTYDSRLEYDGMSFDRFIDTGPMMVEFMECMESSYRATFGMDVSLDDTRYADYLLSFTQVAIVYPTMVVPDGNGYKVSDSDDAAGDYVLYGAVEHYSFPIETLHVSSGDCKNTSSLYCSMLAVAGYDSYMVAVEGHMLTAVELDFATVDSIPDTSLVLYTAPVDGSDRLMYFSETTFTESIPAGLISSDTPEQIEADTSEIVYIPPIIL